jgi:hypothetical protein
MPAVGDNGAGAWAGGVWLSGIAAALRSSALAELGAFEGVVTCTHWENAEVLPAGSVAVAEIHWLGSMRVWTRNVKEAAPSASVAHDRRQGGG